MKLLGMFLKIFINGSCGEVVYDGGNSDIYFLFK